MAGRLQSRWQGLGPAVAGFVAAVGAFAAVASGWAAWRGLGRPGRPGGLPGQLELDPLPGGAELVHALELGEEGQPAGLGLIGVAGTLAGPAAVDQGEVGPATGAFQLPAHHRLVAAEGPGVGQCPARLQLQDLHRGAVPGVGDVATHARVDLGVAGDPAVELFGLDEGAVDLLWWGVDGDLGADLGAPAAAEVVPGRQLASL